MASGLQPSDLYFLMFSWGCTPGWYGVAPLALNNQRFQEIAVSPLSSYTVFFAVSEGHYFA
jgi:hypothetical protein